jgi:tetratricopeptide (TPR) repeat protein
VVVVQTVGGEPAAAQRLRQRADRALEQAALRPVDARGAAQAVLAELKGCGAWDVVCIAERALGVASMNLNMLDDAVLHLRAAIAAGARSDGGCRVSEARMSLASALVLRGSPGQALRTIEAALHELDGLPAARAKVQYAAIQQELGHDDAALTAAKSALPVLRAHGDAEWAARAYSNRSLIHVQRREFGAARRDLQAARALCDEHGLELPAAYAEHNLGWLDAQRGDVPAALSHLRAAEDRYERHGVVEPSLLLDRAQVLLSVRLLDEARATAEAAVAEYRSQNREVHLPEAQLLLSTVALVQGDAETARNAAAASLKGYRGVGRRGAVALARYATIQAQVALDPSTVAPATIGRVARDLADAGWTVPALEGQVLAGRLAIDRGQVPLARRYLALASHARTAGPADARARAWLAEAMLRRADGRRSAAQAALRAGVRIVDDHQASLGATELRAHVSVHRGALVRLGLRMALEDGHARRAFWWAERDRASSLLSRPAQPPDDPELAQYLADLRSTMTEIDDARTDDRGADTLLQRQVSLERRIRDRCRQLNGSGAASATRREQLAEIPALLGDRALVEYAELDGRLHAVTIAGERVRLHPLGPAKDVTQALAPVPFALHRLARVRRTAPAGAAAALAALRRAAVAADDLLLQPLRPFIEDRPLVVVPTPALHSVPWSLLPCCAGRSVSTCPSATLWRTALLRPPPHDDAPVVVVGGPGLSGAVEEVLAVAALHRNAVLLPPGTATVTRVLEHMDGARLLHLSAHGTARADNALFSSVLLDDGPVTVYELERLRSAPRHVTLAACDTAKHQVVAGTEVLGIGAALLGAGTVTLVAPVVSVPDAATVGVMRSFHQHLVEGKGPAAALAAAQAEVDRDEPAAVAAAAGFVCLGAG